MKIVVKTANAKNLKAKIIKDSKGDNLNTWDYMKNDKDEFITHNPVQWADKVILVFTQSEDNKELVVTPSFWEGKPVPTDDEFGTIMGRFSERLWIQYRSRYSSFESIL